MKAYIKRNIKRVHWAVLFWMNSQVADCNCYVIMTKLHTEFYCSQIDFFLLYLIYLLVSRHKWRMYKAASASLSAPAEGVYHLLIGNQAVTDFSCLATHPINLTVVITSS